MLQDFLISRISQELPFAPNEGQQTLLGKLANFLTSREEHRVFLLRGYAGTGKTSIMAALVRALKSLEQKTMLLAPTGRAAKVLSAYSGLTAYTIHKCIYRQKQIDSPNFNISYNASQDTLFIVDEASMISNQKEGSFGSGRLLDDLLSYIFEGRNCSVIFVGDTAQLPPVGQAESPALDEDYLRTYDITLTSHTLTQVARQSLKSGILLNATRIREDLALHKIQQKPQIQTTGYTDIHLISGERMLEEIERSYREVGVAETIVVNRSNKRMNLYNRGIRAQILWKEDLLSSGDRLMITRNNYFWTRQYEGLDFLANGDMLEVVRLRNTRQLYGFNFADASLRAIDYDYEIDATLWLDTLTTDLPEDSYNMQRTLFDRIAKDYPEIRSRKELVRTIIENPYYNALQVKHAYAVTCHKAQGGQWKNVFIDAGQITDEMINTDFYRWFYTAITRAREQVYLINYALN